MVCMHIQNCVSMLICGNEDPNEMSSEDTYMVRKVQKQQVKITSRHTIPRPAFSENLTWFSLSCMFTLMVHLEACPYSCFRWVQADPQGEIHLSLYLFPKCRSIWQSTSCLLQSMETNRHLEEVFLWHGLTSTWGWHRLRPKNCWFLPSGHNYKDQVLSPGVYAYFYRHSPLVTWISNRNLCVRWLRG